MDEALTEQKEALEGIACSLALELVKRRDEGLQDAMRLQGEESFHTLKVFVSHKQHTHMHTYKHTHMHPFIVRKSILTQY